MSRRYRAVFWDFGGVITSSPFESFRRFEEARGLPRDFLRETNAINPEHNAWALLERSEVSVDEFDRLFLAETAARGHGVPGRDVVYLDDLGINLKPACALGMHTIKVGDPRVAIAELGQALEIDFGK